jgi:uncharacterized protein (TIGR00266 family)
MEFDISHQPSYAIVAAHMGPGEAIQAEGGAMVSMDPGISVETKARGGILKSLGRSVLGGESFFLNTFRSDTGGTIRLAPSLPGDMMVLDVRDDAPLMVQSGGYIASTEGVEVDTKWGGAKTFFASEGLIMLRISGRGKLVIASFGALDQWTLGPGQTMTVDTGHLVSMTEGIGFTIRTVGGWKSTLFSGEGLVVDLTGPGSFTTQTRSQDAFLSWLIPKLPSQTSSAR